MSRIKTIESIKDIKIIDKAVVASERMKKALIRSKDQMGNLTDDGQHTPSEYAENKIIYTAEGIADHVGHDLSTEIKKVINKVEKTYQKHREKKRIEKNEQSFKRYEEPFRKNEHTTSDHSPSNQAEHNSISSSRDATTYKKTDRKSAAENEWKSIHTRKNANNAVSRKVEMQGRTLREKRSQTPKVPEQTKYSIKQSARSVGKKAIKNGAKGTIKTAEKTVKTAEKTSKATVKTVKTTAKAAQKTIQVTIKAAMKTAEMAKQVAIATYRAAIVAAKAIAAAIKALIAAVEELIAAIVAGGWVAVVVVAVICLIGFIVGSCFGIFFSSEDTGSLQTLQHVVQEINMDYQNKLDDIKSSNIYDELIIKGSRAVWPEILSIYAVKTTNDKANPQEVASMTDEKEQILKDIFWDMNEICYKTEEKTETVIEETCDSEGNTIEKESEKTMVYLYITVSHKTIEEMMAKYGFTEDQKTQVAELLAQDSVMWTAVLYGTYGTEEQIVAVALSQIGNVGGEPYWSWYGFSSRIEWCACFVSWCANECGLIEAGMGPRFSSCSYGVSWFKEHNQWLDGNEMPSPGMIIFFDWDNRGSSGPQDGLSDHVGIVEKIENGYIYTIEGNSGDMCKENRYKQNSHEILGYGILYDR